MTSYIKITITFSEGASVDKFKGWLKPLVSGMQNDQWTLVGAVEFGANSYTLSVDSACRREAGEIFERLVGCLKSGKGIWSKSYIVEDSLSDENRVAAFKVLSRIEAEMRNVFTRALAQREAHKSFVAIDEEADMEKKNRSLGPWYYAFTLNEYMQFLGADRSYGRNSSLSLGLIEHIFDSEDMSEAKSKIRELKERKPIGELLFTDWESVRSYFVNKNVANIRNRVCHFHPVADSDVSKLRELEKLVDKNIPKVRLSGADDGSYGEFASTLARLEETMEWIGKMSTTQISPAIASILDLQGPVNSALSSIKSDSYFLTSIAAQKAAFEAIGGINLQAQKAAFDAISGIGAPQKAAFDAISRATANKKLALEALSGIDTLSRVAGAKVLKSSQSSSSKGGQTEN